MTTFDPALIQRAKEGDVAAFTALVNFYYPRCLRFAQLMLHSPEDAEEAVQDAFVRAHGALARYREEERFDAWLFRILANRCRTAQVRRRNREKLLVLGDVALERASTAPTDDASAWREEIVNALDMLPAEQREAFLLRHVEGMGYEDIAAATGVGLSALKMRVKRAVDFLRERLKEVERA